MELWFCDSVAFIMGTIELVGIIILLIYILDYYKDQDHSADDSDSD